MPWSYPSIQASTGCGNRKQAPCWSSRDLVSCTHDIEITPLSIYQRKFFLLVRSGGQSSCTGMRANPAQHPKYTSRTPKLALVSFFPIFNLPKTSNTRLAWYLLLQQLLKFSLTKVFRFPMGSRPWPMRIPYIFVPHWPKGWQTPRSEEIDVLINGVALS